MRASRDGEGVLRRQRSPLDAVRRQVRRVRRGAPRKAVREAGRFRERAAGPFERKHPDGELELEKNLGVAAHPNESQSAVVLQVSKKALDEQRCS